jgi:hypothetical protein
VSTRRLSTFAITVIPSLVLLGCVSGTARVGPAASSSTSACSLAGADDAATPNCPDTSVSPPVPEYDGGVAIAAYDAESEATPPVSPPDTAPSWWPAGFVPGSLPDPASGRGNHAGTSACGNCHKAGGPAGSYVWVMGGIVYTDASSTTPVTSAEIGVKTPTQFAHAYSAGNGYFWLPASAGAIDWSTAEIRIRTATGEVKMSSRATSGDCQTCHTAGNRIFAKP